MSRINNNVASLVAQRHLSVSQRALTGSLERLASGLKINRGADNPAGLIVSERLRAEVAAVNQAIRNTARASNVIATTEGALNEVAALLTDIQALLVEAANSGAFSDEEVAANQLQIDSSIDSITRIANTTSFAGRKVINGELDYVTSGIDSTRLADVRLFGAEFGSQPFLGVNVRVLTSAQQAQLSFTGPGLTATPVTVDIAGPDGIVTLSFPASATTVQMVSAINAQVDSTGVRAVASGAGGVSGMRIYSDDYGTDAFVSVRPIVTGAFTVRNRSGVVVPRTTGRDASATINGVQTTSHGLSLSVSNNSIAADVTLSTSFGGGSLGVGSSTFAITSGGALFQIGPQVNTNLQENIGIPSLHANKIGNAIVGYLADLKSGQSKSLASARFKEASEVVSAAITQVAVVRGRLGAFEKDTLQTNANQLQITAENLLSSESVIRDTDFAEETSELTRAQILVQAGNSILAIANAQSQNVLTLLGG
ncbi:MAG: flagellin [Planctomycetota bacterium]